MRINEGIGEAALHAFTDTDEAAATVSEIIYGIIRRQIIMLKSEAAVLRISIGITLSFPAVTAVI